MLNAPNPIFALQAGAVVEIKYPSTTVGAEGASYRWLVADIIECQDDTWPLARLSDGQLTEIRPYMSWRLIQAKGHRFAA